MSGPDIERIERHFHVLAFDTGSCRNGVVVKFHNCYFKIYDSTDAYYSVQLWSYGKQMPDLVEKVRMGDLIPYMQNVLCIRRKYV